MLTFTAHDYFDSATAASFLKCRKSFWLWLPFLFSLVNMMILLILFGDIFDWYYYDISGAWCIWDMILWRLFIWASATATPPAGCRWALLIWLSRTALIYWYISHWRECRYFYMLPVGALKSNAGISFLFPILFHAYYSRAYMPLYGCWLPLSFHLSEFTIFLCNAVFDILKIFRRRISSFDTCFDLYYAFDISSYVWYTKLVYRLWIYDITEFNSTLRYHLELIWRQCADFRHTACHYYYIIFYLIFLFTFKIKFLAHISRGKRRT